MITMPSGHAAFLADSSLGSVLAPPPSSVRAVRPPSPPALSGSLDAEAEASIAGWEVADAPASALRLTKLAAGPPPLDPAHAETKSTRATLLRLIRSSKVAIPRGWA